MDNFPRALEPLESDIDSGFILNSNALFVIAGYAAKNQWHFDVEEIEGILMAYFEFLRSLNHE